MNNQLNDDVYSSDAVMQEASLLILNGQPYEAYELLDSENLLNTELGQELTKHLPLYDQVEEQLIAFEQAIQKNQYVEAHEISKGLPDLIYPEALEIQRLSVSIFVEDPAFMNTMLERLPKNHPFRLQIQNINTIPLNRKSSNMTKTAFAAAVLAILVAGGIGYASHLNENQMEQKLSDAASQNTSFQKEQQNQSAQIKQLEQKLAASQEELQSSEVRWTEEREQLEQELLSGQSGSTGVRGLQAYAAGNYQEAVGLLNDMKPVGKYNQETIDFYKLMAVYKTKNTARQDLDTYEAKYPKSDYLGDAYFSYLMTLRNQEEYDALKKEMKKRFADDWFISAM